MARKLSVNQYAIVYITVLLSALLLVLLIDRLAVAPTVGELGNDRIQIVLDAGHGGEDGGAVSCTGVTESQLNLQITLRLYDLLRMLGCDSILLRSEDVALHTEGNTIAQRKLSDLKHRAEITNGISNAILVSIHQNTFPDSRYHGAQVFFASTDGSEALAKTVQSKLTETLNIGSRRLAQKSSNVYLMSNIHCPAILVECGFLSNPREEALLRDADYQKKLCCVIATVLCDHLDRTIFN